MKRESDIECILDSRWVPKAGKYVVRLGFNGERAKDVWMTEKQLTQLEGVFRQTPHGYSTQRAQVIGIWNERGYYAYARIENTSFIPPDQYNLKDLEDD